MFEYNLFYAEQFNDEQTWINAMYSDYDFCDSIRNESSF